MRVVGNVCAVFGREDWMTYSALIPASVKLFTVC